MSMADVVQWTRTAQRSGVLTVKDEGAREVSVTFRDGRIIFSTTNDSRDQVGRYLVYRGLCNDKDIDEAMKIQQSTGAMLASVLVRLGRIPTESIADALEEKTLEDLCDTFLWKEGSFSFEPKLTPIKSSITIDLDPLHVVSEGVRRTAIWNRITAYIHARSFFEALPISDHAALRSEDPLACRRVLQLLDGERSVSDLFEILPLSRYKIYRAVAELLELKLIRASDTTGFEDREKRLGRKLEEAREAVARGRWGEAMEILEGLSSANPGRKEIFEEFLKVAEGFRDSVYRHNFLAIDVPVVTIGTDAIPKLQLEPTDAFILTRIDGKLSVADILRITPVTEFDGLRSFRRLLTAKVIDFPHRKG